MKIIINLFMVVAGAAIGLVVGFALRSNPVKAASTTQDVRGTNDFSPAVLKIRASFEEKQRALARKDDSPLATKLARDLSMSSGVTRWLYWLEALEKAAPADCPRLAELARGNSTLVRLVATRWIEMDPKHLFDTIASGKRAANLPVGELQRLLFEEWPKRDLEAVIAALSKGQHSGVPESWRRSFAGSLVEKDPERGLRLMSEWAIDSYGPRMTGVKKWAAANPRHAAEFALANSAGYASQSVMETIGKEWGRIDPAAALEFAASRRGEFASILAGSALKAWTERNLDDAAAWLEKADTAARNRLSPSFVEAWAKRDAASALKWSEANLTGITFANAAAGLVKGAAAQDLTGAAELVNSMAPSRARAEAATVLMQKWLPDYSSDKAVPPEATTWLASLDSESVKRVLEQVKWQWADRDANGLKSFVRSLNADQVPPEIYSTLARYMARRDPTETLAWANDLPEANRLGAGNEAFSEWQRSQPESARQWLDSLPADDARRGPFFENVVSTIAYDPRGPDRLATMTPAERTVARRIIEKMPLPEERRAKLIEVLNRP